MRSKNTFTTINALQNKKRQEKSNKSLSWWLNGSVFIYFSSEIFLLGSGCSLFLFLETTNMLGWTVLHKHHRNAADTIPVKTVNAVQFCTVHFTVIHLQIQTEFKQVNLVWIQSVFLAHRHFVKASNKIRPLNTNAMANKKQWLQTALHIVKKYFLTNTHVHNF